MNSKRDQCLIVKKVREQLGEKYKEKAPPSKSALAQLGIDIEKVEWMFRCLRITLRDAFITYEDADIRLVHLFDLHTQRTRRKLKAADYKIIREFRDDPSSLTNEIPKKVITELIKKIDARSEAAVGGRVICKKPLVDVIHHFDRELMKRKRSMNLNYPFATAQQRSRMIALWVNWFFKMKYGIESKYKPEQIRKLIDGTYQKRTKMGTGVLPK